MHRYLANRLLLALPTLFGISLLIFVVMRLLPGDPLIAFLDVRELSQLTPDHRASLMHDLGLDDPMYVQYGRWMKDVITGRLGESFLRGDPLSRMFLRRGPISAEIAVLAIVISWVVGIPSGIVSAIRPNSAIDSIVSFFSVLFLAIPSFWLGLLIVVALLQVADYKSPILVVHFWEDPWANFQIVIGPAAVLGLGAAAQVARFTRSSLFEILHEDYVRTARAKGLSARLVLVRHALPNAMLPVLTISGIVLALLLGGSVAVEKAFGVPGLGLTLVDAAMERDYSVVQNLTLLYAFIFVVVNIIVDITYGWLDPRIRLG